MKSKIFTLFLLATILLSVGMISAAEGDVTFNPIELALTGEQGETVEATFKITSITATDLTDISDITSDLIKDTFTIASSNLEIIGLEGLELEKDIESGNINLSITIPADQEVGEYTGTIEIWGILTTNSLLRGTLNISLTVTESTTTTEDSFCSIPDMEGDLRIKKVKIVNHGPSNDGEDEKWFPLDRITVQVELENDGEVEIEDMVFQLGLFEKDSTTDIAEDMFWISDDDEEIEIGDIEEHGEDDELEHTFEFRVNPEDLEEGNYVLKIKIYSDDLGEDNACIDYADDLTDFGTSEFYAEIDIDKEEEDEGRAVVVDTKKLPPILEAGCNDEVLLDLDVWNIGDADQEQVKVTLYNSELGIDMEYTIRESMDMGDDKEEVDFNFIIPKDAEEKTYTLELRTLYDYDDDDDLYDEQSDVFLVFLRVQGNCRPEVSDAVIIAELDPETPEAIAGKQVIIRATITNPGDAEATYSISIEGNAAWSSLGAIDPQTITLTAGASQEVSIYLNLNTDAEGEKEFTIKATSIEGSVKEQKVALTIKKGMSQDKIVEHIKNNWFIYAIVIINLILIIAIISVVKRIAGKPIAM